jgi:hypothetical protein
MVVSVIAASHALAGQLDEAQRAMKHLRDHAGFRAAIREVLPEAAFQRCYLGSLKNPGLDDSLILNESRSVRPRDAGMQGTRSAGVIHHWLAAATRS